MANGGKRLKKNGPPSKVRKLRKRARDGDLDAQRLLDQIETLQEQGVAWSQIAITLGFNTAQSVPSQFASAAADVQDSVQAQLASAVAANPARSVPSQFASAAADVQDSVQAQFASAAVATQGQLQAQSALPTAVSQTQGFEANHAPSEDVASVNGMDDIRQSIEIQSQPAFERAHSEISQPPVSSREVTWSITPPPAFDTGTPNQLIDSAGQAGISKGKGKERA